MNSRKQILAALGFAATAFIATALMLAAPACAQGLSPAIMTFAKEIQACHDTFASSGWYDGLDCEDSAILELQTTAEQMPNKEAMFLLTVIGSDMTRHEAIADAVDRGNMSKEDGLVALDHANLHLIEKIQTASAHGDFAR